jgi:hypothetical protein
VADHIPFVTGDDVCTLANDVYGDSAFVRVSVDRAATHCPRLRGTMKVWLDPGVDGMDDLGTRRSQWLSFMSSFPNFRKIGASAYHVKPVAAEVYAFVSALMDKCAAQRSVEWITVPQLPAVDGADRNRMNRELAAATGRWRSARGFSGRLILPLVFTNQRQINRKTERNPKVQQAGRCYRMAQADGFWVVESSLRDDDGSSTLKRRLPGVIALHEELNASIPSRIRIAGPYWGLNLVLWARGLVDHPAIGIGGGYQLLLAGGSAKPAAVRLMLPSLRRRVRAAQLDAWLDAALRTLGRSHSAYTELSNIRNRYALLSDPDAARRQVATNYKRWFDLVAGVPRTGRSMALFQDLSAAFALGRSLPHFGPDEGAARKPEAVAEPLMLNCL